MISGPGLLIRACPLLLYMLYGASGCVWSQWSSCRVTCGKGIRTRVGSGSDCTQPSTEKCNATISCYASHLARLGVTVTQHPSEPAFNPARVTSYMIDGWTNSTTNSKKHIDNQKCGQTGEVDNPWVRLDLKKAYLVSSVGVIIFSHTGENVVVRVGSSLINNGNDNPECGPVPYNKVNSMQITWRNVSCSSSLWGRYINFQRTGPNVVLEICEAVFSYAASLDSSADIVITKDGSNVSGTSEIAIKEQGLVQSIDCAVSKSNLTAYLTWKHRSKIVPSYTSAQQSGIYQVTGLQSQRLYIKKTTYSDGGVYSCELTIENTVLLSRNFSLHIVAGYAKHLSSLAVTVTQHPKNRQRPSRNKRLVIDGMPTTVNGQSLGRGSSCASTDRGDNPWVRLDLKKAYLVSVVRVIIFGSTGQNVAVRVGSSLTNNGSGNHQCGNFPYVDNERTKAIWRNVSCSPPVWGRYINFDRTVTDHYLEVCEVAFNYDAIVDIRIESSSVKGKSLSVYKGQGLQTPIDCIESTAYNVSLTWKFGDNVVQKLSNGQKPSIYQVNKNNTQRLHITATTASDNGKYSCDASIGSTTVLSKSFTLYFKVDCIWGAWSSTCNGNCGFGTQMRIAVPEKHGGKPCEASPVQFCDTQQKPCKPTISDRGASVVEGDKVVLSCHSSQYSDSSNHITFEWFKVQSPSSLTSVITDSSRVVSTTSRSPNGTVTDFSSTLTFESAALGDAGDYKCKASNQHGISIPSASATITVKSIPSEPRNFKYIIQPPSHVHLSWTTPLTPNGIIQHYRVQYWREDKKGNVTVMEPVNQLNCTLNLEPSAVYIASVQAYTVGYGAAARIFAVLHAITPSSPLNVVAAAITFSSVKVTWTHPHSPNGDLKFYKVYYRTSSSEWRSTMSETVAFDENSYNITGLNPYTNYSVYVTVTNNAQDRPESQPSNIVQTRTLVAPPDRPPSPRLNSRQFIAPKISDANGPIKFVDIIICYGSGPMNEHARAMLYNTGVYTGNHDWYIKRYSWKEYESSIAKQPISTEDILSPVRQTNGKDLLTSGYTVYIRVVALNSTGGYITAVSEEASYIASEASSSELWLWPMAVIVIVVSLVLTTIIIVIAIVCQRRNQHLQTLLQNEKNARDSFELAAATRNPAYGEVYLPGSEATCTSKDAPKNVENKLDEEDYEDVSSCNIEKDENIANAKGNQQEE